MGGDATRPMWWQPLITTMLLLATVSIQVDALCPSQCRCNEEILRVTCASSTLEVVPIQLNPEIRHIDLSNNKITSVHFTLKFYNHLLTLDLSTNKIKTLGLGNFESQRNLKHLNLSRNEIENFLKETFRGLRAVTTLDLSFNQLEELTRDTFQELHSLQVLKLSQNRLVFLEEGIFKLTKQLKELFLDNNLFLEIPNAALTDALKLIYLSLSNNLIKTVDEDDMPSLPDLRTLLLDKNIINDVHQSALSGLLVLDHLDLSDNNFTVIPTASLAKLSNITKLKLSGNFISAVPPVAFRGLFHLRLLKLDREEFLERVDVRAFVDNINLEKIWLDDNIAMERLPTRLLHGNPRVTYLSVRNNRLTNLEVTHFPLDQLQVLKLGGNPFECNCSLSWLWHLVHEQKLKEQTENNKNGNNQTADADLIVDLDEIRCASPENLANVLLADVTESQVDCSVGWITVVSATSAILFILIILGVLLYWGPMKRVRAKDKEIPMTETKNPTCSNGQSEAYDSRIEKSMIGPPLAHDYRTLPPWDIYQECPNTMNIYEQLDNNHRTRPHIVYV